ncbi:MAG: VWA domain-containing protein [Solirubrobacterales bacterium]|nr:VWA domain-containing protein [Solirubrobacterales bacterium]
MTTPLALTFASPGVLFALIAIPLAMLAYAVAERRRARRRSAFASPALLPAVAPRPAGWRRHVAPFLYALALAALIVALAKPQATVAVDVERATVIFVTDRSGSMTAKDVQPSRLVAAQRAARAFLDAAPRQVRVGLVAFNQRPALTQSPTTDRAAMREAIAAIEPAGGTATGDALALALRAARRPVNPGEGPPPAALVLLSDGVSTRGRSTDEVARAAKKARVPVSTIALGTPDGTIEVPRRDGSVETRPVPPDPDALRRIAEISGGRAYRAEDAQSLKDVYDRLGRRAGKKDEQREVTAAAAGAGLLLLVLGAGSSLRFFGRLP